MKLSPLNRVFLLGSAAILTAVLVVAGCKTSHPDEKSAVTTSLNNNNLGSVSVSQDRDKGVMTLKGDVGTEDMKSQAENIAKQAAPDYMIANEIGVRPAGDEGQAGAVSSNLEDRKSVV